jgi:hypothetical protein
MKHAKQFALTAETVIVRSIGYLQYRDAEVGWRSPPKRSRNVARMR